jgi:hypothetical protein
MSTLPADPLRAFDLWNLRSYSSPDDFSGRAALFADSHSSIPLNVDIIIQSVSFRLEEHLQVTPHIGDTFDFFAHGKAPAVADVTALLAESPDCRGKQSLMPLYYQRLRMSAAARTGNLPVLEYLGARIQGPWTALRVIGAAAQEDMVNVQFSILVLKAVFADATGSVTLDYSLGSESLLWRSDKKENPKNSGAFTKIKVSEKSSFKD